MTLRRTMIQGLGAAALWGAMPWQAQAAKGAAGDAKSRAAALAARLAAIEAGTGGRLGVAVRGGGLEVAHRGAELFPMTSTFKLLAAAAVLRRVDAGQDRLDRVLRFSAADLVTYSPVTQPRADGPGMTLAELCDAAVTLSDNTAGNLLLGTLGRSEGRPGSRPGEHDPESGPAGLTAFARALGDPVTRLDRWETALNEAAPGDPRDTTSPAAMLGLLEALLLGKALSDASRGHLLGWLLANRTGDRRLRAGLPAGWRAAEKTGTGGNGTANDVGVLLPPGGRPPLLVSVYMTGATVPLEAREEAIAEVARAVVAAAG